VARNFLKEGDQTKITPEVVKIASSISGENLDFIFNALAWVKENISWEPNRSDKMKLFRKRTADEIIKSGFATGCTDMALAFVLLARAKGIPTKYVETVGKKWLETKSRRVVGHVFAECFVNGKWVKIDPTKGAIYADRAYRNFIVLAEGLDSWDIGVRSVGDLREIARDYVSSCCSSGSTS